MSQNSAKKLNKLLLKAENAEKILLVKRNKNLAKNLKRLLKCKQKIANYQIDDSI